MAAASSEINVSHLGTYPYQSAVTGILDVDSREFQLRLQSPPAGGYHAWPHTDGVSNITFPKSTNINKYIHNRYKYIKRNIDTVQ